MRRSQLIAWMDGELEEAESHAVKRHVAECAGCREAVRGIERQSRAIAAYCGEMGGGRQRRRWWIPVAAAAAVLIAAGLFSVKQPAPRVAVGTAATIPPVLNAAAQPAPAQNIRHAVRPRRLQRYIPRPEVARGEPGVTIVIPLDEVMPVGAAPPGAILVGSLAFDAGGQLNKIRLQ